MKKKQTKRTSTDSVHSARSSASGSKSPSQSRRRFLGNVGGLTAATLAAGVVGMPALGLSESAEVKADDLDIAQVSGKERVERAYNARVQAAVFQKIAPLPEHLTNGDEELYGRKIGNYSKGLPHNNLDEVETEAYNSLLKAATGGNPDDFDRIVMGGPGKLTGPQGGLAFDMQGADPGHAYQPPAPAFASAEIAAEIAENYWMALARDVNFLDYESHPITIAAAQDMSKFSDFRGPKFRPFLNLTRQSGAIAEDGANVGANDALTSVRGEFLTPAALEVQQLQSGAPARRVSQQQARVTPATLFRGNTVGDLIGPYISQFLWKEVPYGVQTISQRMRTVNPGVDYLTSYNDFIFTQNGNFTSAYPFDPTPRYIRNMRDLAEWVHIDVLFQAYFNAMLILMGAGAPVDQNNPYKNSRNQAGFSTFGPPHIASMVCAVASPALKAVWYQKWMVHRRLRPEEFAGRVHNRIIGAASYPVHPEILNSAAMQEVHRKYNTYLLPMAFPEGCPTHPAYGAGHATVAGVCVTILKAWFDENWVIPEPVVPTADGLALVPYRGASLTVGGELNKLAANVAFGRNGAGVHWRTDAWESLKLGEAMAISILTDFKNCYNERFDGFSLTKFDGSKITIG